jgi:hypothetical protein
MQELQELQELQDLFRARVSATVLQVKVPSKNFDSNED